MIERRTTRVNLKQRPCGKYNIQEYLDCSKEKFWNLFQTIATCVVFNIKEFVPKNQTLLPLCTSREEARKTISIFIDLANKLTARSLNFGCLIPCTTISYNFKADYQSKNVWIHFENQDNVEQRNNFPLYLCFETMDTEERTENLIYDLGNFLVAAGGNLGLFMGFSCFSLMLLLIGHLNINGINCLQ